ncbi:MAG: radical SAM protein [Bryobacteraceae bacterium]
MNARFDRLPILILYPHNRCNCRCVMCDIWKTDQVKEISANDLDRHLADMERLRVEWVVFSGGEPLMHSDLFRLAKLLRARSIRTTLLSTGLLVKRHASQIVNHLDDVVISLDGPPEIHDNVRRVPGAFTSLRAGVNALFECDPSFPVSLRCTVQKLNCSRLCQTARTARGLGVRSISFLAADVTSSGFNRAEPWPILKQDEVSVTISELPSLDAEIEALIQEEDCGGFVLESPEKLRRIADRFRARIGLAQPVAPLCNAPWVSAVVEADGTVRPCFFHAAVGSIANGDSLLQVLNGDRATAFRHNLDVASNPTCRQCVCSLHRKM